MRLTPPRRNRAVQADRFSSFHGDAGEKDRLPVDTALGDVVRRLRHKRAM